MNMELYNQIRSFIERNQNGLYTRTDFVEMFGGSYKDTTCVLHSLISEYTLCRITGFGATRYTHIKNKDYIEDVKYCGKNICELS